MIETLGGPPLELLPTLEARSGAAEPLPMGRNRPNFVLDPPRNSLARIDIITDMLGYVRPGETFDSTKSLAAPWIQKRKPQWQTPTLYTL
jgi:hypothetical protein